MDVVLDGTDGLMRVITRAADAGKLLEQAMVAEAGTTMEAAKRITPYFAGALRASGKVEKPKRDANVVSIDITFGGAAAPYALWVHERVDLHHQPPTQAKFLESAALERAPQYTRHLAERMAQILRAG
jgi:hypothetical protein